MLQTHAGKAQHQVGFDPGVRATDFNSPHNNRSNGLFFKGFKSGGGGGQGQATRGPRRQVVCLCRNTATARRSGSECGAVTVNLNPLCPLHQAVQSNSLPKDQNSRFTARHMAQKVVGL